MRWVQALVCYFAFSFCSPLYAADSQDIAGYVMHVQMTPAACAFDSSRQKQRKCLEGYSLTIASLLPEVPVGRDCDTKTSAKLTPLQEREWLHGRCLMKMREYNFGKMWVDVYQ